MPRSTRSAKSFQIEYSNVISYTQKIYKKTNKRYSYPCI